MPAGQPYFAWIEASETTFEPEHMRWDENVFSFQLEQEEGDPASLTVSVRRPRNEGGDPIGLLGPGRKIWIWFAIDCGPALFKFRGRLVGVPTSILDELVTLEFVARPFDVVAQKEALADTLRVFPYYDEVFIDAARRTDPEVVLEGYTKIWHYDRETHVLTVSDEITGENGVLDFDGTSGDGKVLYDGLGLTLTSGPLSRVDVTAEFTWTQQASGVVDLTDHVMDNWPGDDTEPDPGAPKKTIQSFTLAAGSWPKNGNVLGKGWTVTELSASESQSTQPRTRTESSEITYNWWDGEKTVVTSSSTETYLPFIPVGSLMFSPICTKDDVKTTYATDGDGLQYVASWSRNSEWVSAVLLPKTFTATLNAAFDTAADQAGGGRDHSEKVSLSVVADVQHILTDPEDGEALHLDFRTSNLSEGGDDAAIGDLRRNSYLPTGRGNGSLEYLISVAKAHLMKRARVVEIAFAPKLSRMPEVTLRKSAFLVEPRVGEALGKIIGYSIALDGANGRINCEVRIGCAIGRGGAVAAVAGTPVYCSIEYTGADYQQFIGRTVLIDELIGYEPPLAAPNDDGLNFLQPFTVDDVMDIPLTVVNPLSEQRAYLAALVSGFNMGAPRSGEDRDQLVAARFDAVNNALREVETRATFKLKNINRAFASSYAVNVTQLKIPTGYNLEVE